MNENKHYIRLDSDGYIIKAYSDAFEQPIDGDICIEEHGARQLVVNGVTNPTMFSSNRNPLYRYVNNQIVSEEKINKQSLLDSKIASLNESCRIAIEAGFYWNEKLFKAAENPDQTNIALAGLQFITTAESVIPWETADNEVVMLNFEDFISFSQNFADHKFSQLGKVKTLKAQVLGLDINSETFVEDLNVIVW